MTRVAAVILAGGKGERLGGVNKALLTIGGERFIDRAMGAIDGCSASGGKYSFHFGKGSDGASYKSAYVTGVNPKTVTPPASCPAVTLEDKVVAFEKAFLRAGVKHYPSRQRWAQIALDVYENADWKGGEANPPTPETEPPANWLTALISIVVNILKAIFGRKS